MYYNSEKRILIILSLLMACGCGSSRPYRSQEIPAKSTTTVVSQTRPLIPIQDSTPIPSRTPVSIYGYTIVPESLGGMQKSIKIMFKGMQDFEVSQGIIYNPDDLLRTVNIAACVLADTYFGNQDYIITIDESGPLLDHLTEKYGFKN